MLPPSSHSSMRVVSSLCCLLLSLLFVLGSDNGFRIDWGRIFETGVRSRSATYILVASTELPPQFFLLLLVSLFYVFKLLRLGARSVGTSRRCFGRRSLKRLRRCAPQVLRRCLLKEEQTTRIAMLCVTIFPYACGRGVSLMEYFHQK